MVFLSDPDDDGRIKRTQDAARAWGLTPVTHVQAADRLRTWGASDTAAAKETPDALFVTPTRSHRA